MKKVLVIAESDPKGIAGIQGLVKALAAHKVDSLTIETALSFSKGGGDLEIHTIHESFLKKQLDQMAGEDISAIVVGFIPRKSEIALIMQTILQKFPKAFVVFHPVTLVNGKQVMNLESIHELRKEIFLNAHLCVLNIPETVSLTGQEVDSLESMKRAAEMVITLGCKGALITGGSQMGSGTIHDVLVNDHGFDVFVSKKTEYKHGYGMGYALSAGIAANVSNGMALSEAIEKARAYVQEALKKDSQGGEELDYLHRVSA